MDNQKIENLLNLALETTLPIREKSLNLNVGYEEETGDWELLVKYNGSLSEIARNGIVAEELLAGYAILTVPENRIDEIAELSQIEFIEKPKRLFFAMDVAKESVCLPQITLREPFLDGDGVIVAVIDSGIDYSSPHFRNPDGSSRILYLWDQTIQGKPPEGFSLGTEYTKTEIDQALASDNTVVGFERVPSRDVSGHGTAVAGIAAARAYNGYEGVTPKSELIIVKLGAPRQDSFPRTTELMRALTYVVKRAQELLQPVAINLSFGNTYGAHDGTSLLERFIDNASEVGKCVICVGSGNEGASAGHVQGRLEEGGLVRIELAVSRFESVLNVQLWCSYTDVFRVTLYSPGGMELPIVMDGQGKSETIMDGTRILVYMGEPQPYAVTREVYVDFIPIGEGQSMGYVAPGVWTFLLEAVNIVTGQYYFYLPVGSVRNSATRFLTPAPQVSLTIPSTAGKVITVGAYDAAFESYADFSGRGYVYGQRTIGLFAAGAVKPDLAAPGVSIPAPNPYGGYAEFTGTSFATPFVTGAAALLMQWGIVQGNDPFLYGEKVKAYLRKGAKPIRGETIYPNDKVGFGALCVSDSLPPK